MQKITRNTAKSGCLLLFILLSICLKAQLKADFTTSATSGCTPLVVRFTDSCTGNPTQWKWDLGNGTISYLQNPSATYFNPGTYTVKLTATNKTGTDFIIKTAYITVFAKPTIKFSASATSGCIPLTTQFINSSTAGSGTIEEWHWDFGDGYSSNLENPIHVYTNTGNFNASLKIKNSNQCFTAATKIKYIKTMPTVKANFINSAPNNCSLPVAITFTNKSTGTAPLTYQWQFGDSGISTKTNPAYSYSSNGSYSVKLIVSNAAGCSDTMIKPNAILITPVKADFASTNIVCLQHTFSITNTSVTNPVSAAWNFGDGSSSTAMNPTKTYALPGNYAIRLISNFGKCADTTSKVISVKAKPATDFTADQTISCAAPATFNFADASAGAIGYQWNFGDGSSSAEANPTYTYPSYGNFSVRLISTNSFGCADTLQKKLFIKIQAPVVSLTNLPDKGCIPFTKKFTCSIISIDPVVSYLWDFGDGNSSTNPAPTHVYVSIGSFTITLTTTTLGGCTNVQVAPQGIITNIKPVANFTADRTTSCAKDPINFTDLSSSSTTNWAWNFGDGTNSDLQNPSHSYTDTGYFTVRLVAWNNGCNDTLIFKKYIYINPAIARFDIVMDCKKPFDRTFTNKSVGADTWNWDFGDGFTATTPNQVHSFASTGLFEVVLLVNNNLTGCSYTSKKIVQVVNEPAAFYAVNTAVCKGSNIYLNSGLNTALINNFRWDFGDGSIVNTIVNTATHIYTLTGNYATSLITTNILGCKDTLSKNAYIRINGPIAKFQTAVPGSCIQTAVTLNNLSTDDGINPIQTYNWDYGDSTTASLTGGPFQHIYAASGAYSIQLKLTDNIGCMDSFTLATPLIISQPTAQFYTTNTVSCPLKTIQFTNQSTGPNLKYTWQFGDGSGANVQNPNMFFTKDGIYDISLLITDQYGCTSTASKKGYVSISSSIAKFNVSAAQSDCPPLIVQFTDSSINQLTKVWDFGDGSFSTADNPSHFYTYPGTYFCTINSIGPGGCIDTMQKTIIIKGPTGNFNFTPSSGCLPVTVNFTATTVNMNAILWDFNDGNTVSTSTSNISHQYIFAGSYVPKIILTDNDGCQVPVYGTDTLTVNGVTAGFNFNNNLVCDSGFVLFNNTAFSNDIIVKNNWLFGDGNTSTDVDPIYWYSKAGNYFPRLIITTLQGCVDSMLSPIAIVVAKSPQVNILTSANECTPLKLTAKGIVVQNGGSALSWQWNFGNGRSDTLQNAAVQVFNVAGVYPIILIATNKSGCTDTAASFIEAYFVPIVSAGADTFICQHIGINLHATGAITYNWSPAAGLSCTTCASPFTNPDSTTTYTVTGTGAHNCQAAENINVLVKFPFKMVYSKQDTLCMGKSLKLFASGADSYSWLPTTALANANTATPTTSAITSTNYVVIGIDDKNCFSDTGFVYIKVYPIPVVDAGPDKTINIGQSYEIKPVLSADVNAVFWSPTLAVISNIYPTILVKPTQNTSYTIEAKNEGGCAAKDEVNIIVVCNGANVFIPNTFSPNDNGANDIFFPRGTGLFKIKTFRIFNRWGEIVFERNNFNANDPAFGWNGTYKGIKLKPDVYVYTIDIICDNKSILNYKGDIALIL